MKNVSRCGNGRFGVPRFWTILMDLKLQNLSQLEITVTRFSPNLETLSMRNWNRVINMIFAVQNKNLKFVFSFLMPWAPFESTPSLFTIRFRISRTWNNCNTLFFITKTDTIFLRAFSCETNFLLHKIRIWVSNSKISQKNMSHPNSIILIILLRQVLD